MVSDLGPLIAKYARGGYGLDLDQCTACAAIERAIHEEVQSSPIGALVPRVRRPDTHASGTTRLMPGVGQIVRSARRGAARQRAKARMGRVGNGSLPARYLDPRAMPRIDHKGRHFAHFGEMCLAWKVHPSIVELRLAMGKELGWALETPARRS